MAFIPFSLALWLVTTDLKEMVAASLDPSTILFTTMTSSIYSFFEQGEMSDYSRTDRILHYLALEHPFFGELIFDIEKTIFGSHTKTRRAIYVTGLARAGTTALMRNLHATGHFASLTYNDMPFVLSPNLWAKISSISTKKRVMQERAHGDGIKVDFDTPEALEEIFWKLHCGSSYISEEALHTHTIDNETIRQLLIYQALICKRHDRPRYLAKNNNHILRLASIAPKTKETTITLLPFRHPRNPSKELARAA